MNIPWRAVGLVLIALLVAVATHAADLGVRVVYKKDAPISFATFTLTYIGERRVVTEKFPPGMNFYDFRVTTPHGTQTITWSSGTGDIGPTLFHVGNEQFALELKRSDKLGKLKDNELVVSRAP